MENNQLPKSGGPKTDEGKAISKYNALRHGILRKTLVESELEEAEIIRTNLLSGYQPQSITEELLIETMIISYIRRQRAFVESSKQWCIRECIDIYEVTHNGRYITASDRQFYQALHGLQRIQSIRKGIKPTSIAVDFTGTKKSD